MFGANIVDSNKECFASRHSWAKGQAGQSLLKEERRKWTKDCAYLLGNPSIGPHLEGYCCRGAHADGDFPRKSKSAHDARCQGYKLTR